MFCFQNKWALKINTLDFVPFPYIKNSTDSGITVCETYNRGIISME